ncbi:MAG TPA: septation protein A [Thiobacillaceae bacterium]|nr:septation protein A [Thiobacillaceae bacterium]
MKKFLFDLFPVIVFFVAYKLGDSNAQATGALMNSLGLPPSPTAKPGIYLATLVAISATFLQVAWVKLRGEKVEAMLWASLVIIVVFGGATLWLHDESFIKWKPTVLYWLFAGVLIGSAMLGKNMIQSIMSAQMELPQKAWSRLNLSWAGFFAFMGLANLIVARNFSTDDWVNFKLFGSLVLMLVFVVIQSLMLNKYLHKEENE